MILILHLGFMMESLSATIIFILSHLLKINMNQKFMLADIIFKILFGSKTRTVGSITVVVCTSNPRGRFYLCPHYILIQNVSSNGLQENRSSYTSTSCKTLHETRVIIVFKVLIPVSGYLEIAGHSELEAESIYTGRYKKHILRITSFKSILPRFFVINKVLMMAHENSKVCSLNSMSSIHK